MSRAARLPFTTRALLLLLLLLGPTSVAAARLRPGDVAWLSARRDGVAALLSWDACGVLGWASPNGSAGAEACGDASGAPLDVDARNASLAAPLGAAVSLALAASASEQQGAVRWVGARAAGGAAVAWARAGAALLLPVRLATEGAYVAVRTGAGGALRASSPVAVAPADGPPVILSVSPATSLLHARRGAPVTLSVEAEAAPGPSGGTGATWRVDGEDVSSVGWQPRPGLFVLPVTAPRGAARPLNVTFQLATAAGAAEAGWLLVPLEPPVLLPRVPAWVAVAAGQPLTLTVAVVTGSPAPLSYEWRWQAGGAATTALGSLALPFVDGAHEGSLRVTACNQVGCAGRPVALSVLVVRQPPVVTSQPPLRVDATSGDALVRVSAAVAGQAVSLAWYAGARLLGRLDCCGGDGEAPLLLLPNATTLATLTWALVTTADATDNLTLLATNPAGAAASRPLALRVAPPPWQVRCDPAVTVTTTVAPTGAAAAAAAAWAPVGLAAGARDSRGRVSPPPLLLLRAAALVAARAVLVPPVCVGSAVLPRHLQPPPPPWAAGGGAAVRALLLHPPPPGDLPECAASAAADVRANFSLRTSSAALTACGWALPPASFSGPLLPPPGDGSGGSNSSSSSSTLAFSQAPGLPPGAELPVCELEVAVMVVVVAAADVGDTAAGGRRGGGLAAGHAACSTTLRLAQVRTAPLPSATPFPSTTATALPSPSGSASATPTLGWSLLPPSASRSASPSPASARVAALAARVDRVVTSDHALVYLVGLLLGGALGLAATAASVAAYWVQRRRKPLRAAAARRAAARPCCARACARARDCSVDALAPFAACVSGWDALAWLQFVALTDALALRHHPAYARFAGAFSPALLLLPTRLLASTLLPDAVATGGGGALALVTPLQRAFDALHALAGEPPAADAWGPALLPLEEDGALLVVVGSSEDASDAELLLAAIRSGARGLPRLSAHVGVTSADLVLHAALSLAGALVALALAAPPLACAAHRAARLVVARYPSGYAVALSWPDVLAWAGRVAHRLVLSLVAPLAVLAATGAWRAPAPSRASACIGALLVLAVLGVLGVRAHLVRRHGASRGGAAGASWVVAGAAHPAALLALVAAGWSGGLLPALIAATGDSAVGQAAALLALLALLLAGVSARGWCPGGGGTDGLPPRAKAAAAAASPAADPAAAAAAAGDRARVVAASWGAQAVLLALLAVSEVAPPAAAADDAGARVFALRASATGGVAAASMCALAGVCLAAHSCARRRAAAIADGARISAGLTAAALARLASTSVTRRSLRVPVVVRPEELGLNRALAGGSSSVDAVGALARWGMLQGLVCVTMTHQVIPELRRLGARARVAEVLQLAGAPPCSAPAAAAAAHPPARPSRVEITVASELARRSCAGSDEEGGPEAPGGTRRGAAAGRGLLDVPDELSMPRMPPRAASDEPAWRVGMGFVRKPRPVRAPLQQPPQQHRQQRTLRATSYAPHLGGGRLPDQFFSTCAPCNPTAAIVIPTSPSARSSAASDGHSARSSSPAAHSSRGGPATPRAVASPLAASAGPHAAPDFSGEQGAKQGYRPQQPRGLFAKRAMAAAKRAAAAVAGRDALASQLSSAQSERDALAVAAPSPPPPAAAAVQRHPAPRRASAMQLIVQSVQSLAHAMAQAATPAAAAAAAATAAGGDSAGATATPPPPPSPAAAPLLSVVPITSTAYQRQQQLLQLQLRRGDAVEEHAATFANPLAAAAASASAAAAAAAAAAAHPRHGPHERPRRQSFAPVTVGAAGSAGGGEDAPNTAAPAGAATPGSAEAFASWQAYNRARGPLYAYRSQQPAGGGRRATPSPAAGCRDYLGSASSRGGGGSRAAAAAAAAAPCEALWGAPPLSLRSSDGAADSQHSRLADASRPPGPRQLLPRRAALPTLTPVLTAALRRSSGNK